MPGWQLFITFPNLVPPVPSPFETPELCLCAAQDPRLHDLEPGASTETARRMLRCFATSFGEPYEPGCLLARTDAPDSAKAADALRGFRNVCAIATISHAWATALAHRGAAQWAVKWSDSFLMGYHTPGRDGSLVTLQGMVRGLDDEDSVHLFEELSVARKIDAEG